MGGLRASARSSSTRASHGVGRRSARRPHPAGRALPTARGREDAEADQPGRELAAKTESEPDTRVQCNPRAELLHRDHEWESEQRRPEDAEAKLGAGLRVGADAARVVITRPGDEAWPQDLQEGLGAHPPGGANARLRGGRTAGDRHLIGFRRRFEELVFRRLDVWAELHALESRVVDVPTGRYFPGLCPRTLSS